MGSLQCTRLSKGKVIHQQIYLPTVFALHDYLVTAIVRQLRANFAWSKLTMNCMKSFSCLAYLGEFKVVCIESTYIKENRQFKSAFNMVDFFYISISYLDNPTSYTGDPRLLRISLLRTSLLLGAK